MIRKYNHRNSAGNYTDRTARSIAAEPFNRDEAQVFSTLAIADAITDLADAIREHPTDKPITVDLRITSDPTESEPDMNEYLILRCDGCEETWAMEFQPDPCTCDRTEESPLCDFWNIKADSYSQAIHKAILGSSSPSSTTTTATEPVKG
jgi:hypothetical protein